MATFNVGKKAVCGFQEVAEVLLDGFRKLIDENLKDLGDTSDESQKIALLNALHDFEKSVNGLSVGDIEHGRLEALAQLFCDDSISQKGEAARLCGISSDDLEPVALKDWQLADASKLELQGLPDIHRQQYRCEVRGLVNGSHGVEVALRPIEGGSNNDFEGYDGLKCLSVTVEIDEGLPRVFVTNDPFNAQLISIHSSPDGLLINVLEGDMVHCSKVDLGAVFTPLVRKKTFTPGNPSLVGRPFWMIPHQNWEED